MAAFGGGEDGGGLGAAVTSGVSETFVGVTVPEPLAETEGCELTGIVVAAEA